LSQASSACPGDGQSCIRILSGGRNQPVQLRHEEALAPQVDRFEFSRTQEAAHIFGRRFPVETGDRAAQRVLQPGHIRSEEHTSELQSLMRISYAVFCLK